MTYFRRLLIVAYLLLPVLASAQTNIYCCPTGTSGWPSTAPNLVWASPDGVAGNPLFRSLVAADLPADTLNVDDLPYYDVTQPPFNAACDTVGSVGTDDTAEIQAAIDVVGPHLVVIPRNCKVTDTLLINQDRVHLTGMGLFAGALTFMPTSGGKPLLDIRSTVGAVLFQNTVRDMSIIFRDAAFQKIAIRVTDTSHTLIDRISVWTAAGTGSNSIAIQIRGRESGTVRDSHFLVDGMPLSIEDNPNSTIDLDHWTFQNNTYISFHAGPLINIASGVNHTNNEFIGANNVAAGGSDMFAWVDTTTAAYSYNLKVSGFRWEQAVAAGWGVNIQANHGLRGVDISNNHFNGSLATSNGVRLRGVTGANITKSLYEDVGVCYDIDGSNHHTYMGNYQCIGGSSTTTTGATLTRYEGDSVDNTEPNHPFEWWESSTNANLNTQSFVRRLEAGGLGIGAAPLTATGDGFLLNINGNHGTRAIVRNTDTGANAFTQMRVEADVANFGFHVYSSGTAATIGGLAAANFAWLFQTAGNGMFIGMQTADPIYIVTNNTIKARFDATTAPVGFDTSERCTSASFASTSTTLANVSPGSGNGLQINAATARKYHFRAHLFVDADATGGHKYAIGGTVTATAVIYQVKSQRNDTAAYVLSSRHTAMASAAGAAGGTALHTIIEGWINVNAGGTLTVQFAQNAAGGTSSVLAGSCLQAFEVQ